MINLYFNQLFNQLNKNVMTENSTFQKFTPEVKEALLHVNNHLLTALNCLDEIASNYLPDPETARQQVIAALKKLPVNNYHEIAKYS